MNVLIRVPRSVLDIAFIKKTVSTLKTSKYLMQYSVCTEFSNQVSSSMAKSHIQLGLLLKFFGILVILSTIVNYMLLVKMKRNCLIGVNNFLFISFSKNCSNYYYQAMVVKGFSGLVKFHTLHSTVMSIQRIHFFEFQRYLQ